MKWPGGYRRMLSAAAFTAIATTMSVSAQSVDDYETFRRQLYGDFDAFSKDIHTRYDNLRDSLNGEYARFLEQAWKAVKQSEPARRPAEPRPQPFEVPDQELNKPLPWQSEPLPAIPHPAPVEPTPAPKPILEIDEQPIDRSRPVISLAFYGSRLEFPRVDLTGFRLKGNGSKQYADGWRQLSKMDLDPLVAACVRASRDMGLADWFFLLLVDRVSAEVTGSDTNEQALLSAFLLSQAGYEVRLASDKSTGRLHLLFATSGTLFRRSRYWVENRWFYPLHDVEAKTLSICDVSFPGSTPLSMAVNGVPKLNFAPGKSRTVKVHGHCDLTLTLVPNKNLIDMFADYPDAGISRDVMSRWTPQAQTPVSPQIRDQVYPTLRKAIEGKDQYDAVDLLLKVAQSFPYGYDDEIWGGERVFFMDESWHYPYSDCEDHAINFTRMVRDLLGLETALLHYPGHIAAAVVITDGSARGDCVFPKETGSNTLQTTAKRYTICDPTYFYASPGQTAPQYRSTAPTLIPLR